MNPRLVRLVTRQARTTLCAPSIRAKCASCCETCVARSLRSRVSGWSWLLRCRCAASGSGRPAVVVRGDQVGEEEGLTAYTVPSQARSSRAWPLATVVAAFQRMRPVWVSAYMARYGRPWTFPPKT